MKQPDAIPSASVPQSSLAQGGLRRLALTSTGYLMGQNAAAFVIRLAMSILLTRMLTPEIYGIFSVVTTIIVGLTLLSDFGVASLILFSSHSDEPSYLDTIWSLQVVRGILLCVVCGALAFPAQALWNESSLQLLIPSMGLCFLIGGFQSTSVFRFQRQLRQRELSIFEVSALLVSAIVTTTLVVYYPSAEALVLGTVAGVAVRVLLSFVYLSDYRPKFAMDRTYFPQLFERGKWIVGSSSATFLLQHADKLFVAYFFDFAFAGIYALASSWAQQLPGIVRTVITQVLAPVVRNAVETPGKCPQAAYYRARRLMDWGPIAGCAFFAVVSPLVIDAFYDHRYSSAGTLVQILSIGAIIDLLASLLQEVLTVRNHFSYGFWANSLRLVWLILSVPAAGHLFGIMGVVWALTLSPVWAFLVFWIGASKYQLISKWKELAFLIPLSLALLLGYITLTTLRSV